MEFENFVQLINYYETHPLYSHVKLTHPISEDTIRRLTMVSKQIYFNLSKYIKLHKTDRFIKNLQLMTENILDC